MSTEPSQKNIPAVIAKNAGKRHREFIRKINRENKALSERVAELENRLNVLQTKVEPDDGNGGCFIDLTDLDAADALWDCTNDYERAIAANGDSD